MPDDFKVIEPESDALVPRIDIDVIVTTGDNRQIKLRTCILQEVPEAQAHKIVDKLFAIGDRQKARYDLEKETEEMDKVATTLTALIAGLPIAQRNFIEAQEKHIAEFKGYEEEYQRLHDEGYEEHTASGRSAGSFKPKGARKANMERQKQAALKVNETMAREKAEAEQLFQTNIKSVEHYREDLAARREKVNALRRLAGLTELDGKMGCEVVVLPTGIEG